MRRIAAISIIVLAVSACGGSDSWNLTTPDPTTPAGPTTTEFDRGLTPDPPLWSWPAVDSYCDPEVDGFRIYLTPYVNGPLGGEMFVIADDSCVAALDSQPTSP